MLLVFETQLRGSLTGCVYPNLWWEAAIIPVLRESAGRIWEYGGRGGGGGLCFLHWSTLTWEAFTNRNVAILWNTWSDCKEWLRAAEGAHCWGFKCASLFSEGGGLGPLMCRSSNWQTISRNPATQCTMYSISERCEETRQLRRQTEGGERRCCF